jgi:hypothetical protein
VQVRRTRPFAGGESLARCSTPVIIGTIVGASLGLLLGAHSAYPAQVVASLATVGANIAARSTNPLSRTLGDALLLTLLLLLTGSIAGWNLLGAGGAVAGFALGSGIAYARFRPR